MVNKDFKTKSQKVARTSGEYWRIAKEAEENKCVFCDLKDKYIIKKSKYSVLTVNIFPYINGQLLVIPKRHIEDLTKVTKGEVLDMHKMVDLGLDLLRKNLKLDNVWVLLRNGNLAGKTVKHLHWNVMPYTEDLNTWHYKEITLAPIDLADKLRSNNKNGRTKIVHTKRNRQN